MKNLSKSRVILFRIIMKCYFIVFIVISLLAIGQCIDHHFLPNSHHDGLINNDLRLNHDFPADLRNRLPKDVLPRKYVIAVSPDFEKNVFHGAVEIICEVLKERNYIALHAKDLNIESTNFCRIHSEESRTPCELESIYPVDNFEMIVLNASKIIDPGIYSIKINFNGKMDNRINGFYLSTYNDPRRVSSKRKLAVTQFEPTYARKTFPCFDEPGLKSIFDIRIIYATNRGYRAMSNMPALNVQKSAGKTDLAVTTFATSLPMSTYLVAFIVSDFTCTSSTVDSITGTTITVSICSQLANRKKVRFALSVATRALAFYMNFFQIDYPLPKIDLVGVPDFAAGAMENWGLVTFRETEIFQSDDDSSVGNIKSVALTIAHELAHMWFGNLVTIDWWDDLWLNEGFATYMEHVAINLIFPDWRQIENFALETKYLTIRSDSKINAHSIVRRTSNANEITQMFDHISYQKSAAVIRMLEDAMGNTKFISGIREYIRKYKFGNASSRQLFDILKKHFESTIDLIDFMKRWTKSPGFPVVNVLQISPTEFQFFQKRFVIGKSRYENSTWDLPIRYVTNRKNEGVQLVWFLANATCAALTVEEPIDWMKLNHQSIGYFIVNYSHDIWNHFSDLLLRNIEILNPLDRADLLHDSFILADSGQLIYGAALNLSKYLVNEVAFQPWVVAASWILRVDRLLADTQLHHRFLHFARFLIDKVYRQIGWEIREMESFEYRELRMVILRLACSIGHRNCLRIGEERLKNFLESTGTIRPHPDLRSIVYSFGLLRLPPKEHLSSYEKMWHLYNRETDPQEKERLLIGLADVREPEMIVKYLERIADENIVRRQNFFEAMSKVSSNPTGLDVVWNFLRHNWEVLVNKYTLNDVAMGNLVGKIVSSFKDLHRLQEAKEFFSKYPEAGAGENSRRLAIEESEINIEWINKNPIIIHRWLRDIYHKTDLKNDIES